MGKGAKPGDVAEVQGPAGRLIYLQYLGAHPEYGDSILVAVRMHDTRPEISVELFRDGYVTFYPFRAALSHGLAQIVGHLADVVPSPESVTTVRAFMEQLAETGGGEYDGWEAEPVWSGQMA
jgi:hypothetical protein